MRSVLVVSGPIWCALFLVACSEHGKGGPPVTNIDAPPGSSVCGGFADEPCGPDEFCDFGRNSCGFADEQGVCVKRPVGCPDLLVPEPVCGCDGQIHSSVCDANAIGVDMDASHRCMVPPGEMACGFRQCNVSATYCEVAGSDVGNEPDTFTCKGLPPCPGPTDCGCLGNEPCGSSCSGDNTKGFTLVCLGG